METQVHLVLRVIAPEGSRPLRAACGRQVGWVLADGRVVKPWASFDVIGADGEVSPLPESAWDAEGFECQVQARQMGEVA